MKKNNKKNKMTIKILLSCCFASIFSLFTGCSCCNNTKIDIQSIIADEARGFKFSEDKKVLLKAPEKFSGHYSVPSGVTTIGTKAFYQCSGLQEITFPDTLTTIENIAFYGCSSLKSVKLPDSILYLNEKAFAGNPAILKIKAK